MICSLQNKPKLSLLLLLIFFKQNQSIISETYFDQILELCFECCGTDGGFQCADLQAISTTHTTSVWRVFFLQWMMSALTSREDIVLFGVKMQHSWHAHNRLWHNVKSSQPNVRGSHFPANRKLSSIRKSKTMINYSLSISLEGLKWNSWQLSKQPSIWP